MLDVLSSNYLSAVSGEPAISSCPFLCLFRPPASNDAQSHWLHLFDFSPLCVFKCVHKFPVSKDAYCIYAPMYYQITIYQLSLGACYQQLPSFTLWLVVHLQKIIVVELQNPAQNAVQLSFPGNYITCHNNISIAALFYSLPCCPTAKTNIVELQKTAQNAVQLSFPGNYITRHNNISIAAHFYSLACCPTAKNNCCQPAENKCCRAAENKCCRPAENKCCQPAENNCC